MKKVVLISSILLLQGCSTHKKSKMYGAIAGSLVCGTLGAYLGKELSPNKASESFNKVLGASTGAVACGGLGYYLGGKSYEEDPRNQEGPPIIIRPAKTSENNQQLLNTDIPDIEFSDLSMVQDGNAETPFIKGLPDELKKKVKKQKLIKYKIKPQVITTKDGRKLYFAGGEAIEHQYEDLNPTTKEKENGKTNESSSKN